MRILHTEWSDGMGGQEKRILAEAAGMSERGHHITILCREHAGIKKEAVKLGIKVRTLPLRKSYDLPSIGRLAVIMGKEKYDIVNTHSGIDSWIGGLAARLSGVPVLVRTRHLNIPLRRNLFNFIHYLPDAYVTCGENMRDNLVNTCGFPGKIVVSVPTGVNSDFFNVTGSREARMKYGLDMHSRVITNVGIMRRIKGHETTIKAAKKVIERVPDVYFLLVGDGPRKEILEKLVKEMGISDRVIFTGFVNNIPEIYSFSDIAVLSSWSEGLPQSLLQAMASGVPVVATNVGGVPEIVFDRETGILVEAGDHEALADATANLLNNAELSAQLAGRARNNVLKHHSVNAMLDKMENLYLDLLSHKK